MIETLPWIAAGVLWVAFTYQLSVARRSESHVSRWLALTFACLAIALTVNLPSVYVWFDHVAGVPNAGEPVVHGLVLVAGWSAQSAIVYFHNDRRSASTKIMRHAAALLVILVLMITFFALASVDAETTEFTTTYAATPYVAQYWLAYLAFLLFVLADVARMNWRYSGPTGDFLGVGLRVLAIGAGFGLVYVVHKGAYVVARRWTDLDLTSSWHTALSRGSMVLCVVLAAIGTTLPRWGPSLSRVPKRIASLRTYRRLEHLWAAMQTAGPDRVLVRPRHPRLDSIDPRDIDFRLYRRVIEIRDGELELRPFVAQSDVDDARRAAATSGLTGRALDAAVEAASLRAALRGMECDRPATIGHRPDQVSPADLEREIDWLLQVANYFERSEHGPREWARAHG